MRKFSALEALFPKIRLAVLRAVIESPHQEWRQSDLAERLAVTPSSLQRELKDLVGARLLATSSKGQRTTYRANIESPLFAPLKDLLSEEPTESARAALVAELVSLADSPRDSDGRALFESCLRSLVSLAPREAVEAEYRKLKDG